MQLGKTRIRQACIKAYAALEFFKRGAIGPYFSVKDEHFVGRMHELMTGKVKLPEQSFFRFLFNDEIADDFSFHSLLKSIVNNGQTATPKIRRQKGL